MPIKMTHTSWQLIRMRLQTPASGPRSPKLISYIYICANMFGKIRLAIRVSMLTASETKNCSTKIYIKTASDDDEDLLCAWVSNSWWLGYFWPPHDAPLIGQASIFYLWVYFKSSSLNLYLYQTSAPIDTFEGNYHNRPTDQPINRPTTNHQTDMRVRSEITHK